MEDSRMIRKKALRLTRHALRVSLLLVTSALASPACSVHFRLDESDKQDSGQDAASRPDAASVTDAQPWDAGPFDGSSVDSGLSDAGPNYDTSTDCVLDGVIIPDGQSATFYSVQLAPFGETCDSYAQVRTCGGGTLTGDPAHRYAACYPEATDQVLRKIIYQNPAGQDRHIGFPQLAALSDQDLVVVFRQSLDHYDSDNSGKLMLSRSHDGGWNWTNAVVTWDTPGWGEAPTGIYYSQATEELVVAVQRTRYPHPDLSPTDPNNHPDRVFATLHSTDQGATWTEGQPFGAFPHGNPVERNGVLFMPAYYGSIQGAGLLKSTDGGVTWTDPTVIFPYVDADNTGTEVALLPLHANGHWLAIARTVHNGTDYYLYQSRSTDNGVTWSTPSYLFRGGPPDLVRLLSGNILFCYTDRVSPSPGRGVLCRISTDDGQTWGQAKHIYQNNSCWDMGYSSTVQLPDFRIISAYYANMGTSTTRPNEGDDLSIQRALYYEDYFSQP